MSYHKNYGRNNRFAENQPEVLSSLILLLARKYHVGCGKSIEKLRSGQEYHPSMPIWFAADEC